MVPEFSFPSPFIVSIHFPKSLGVYVARLVPRVTPSCLCSIPFLMRFWSSTDMRDFAEAEMRSFSPNEMLSFLLGALSS